MKKRLLTFAAGLLLATPLVADVVVNGGATIRTLPDNVGGVMLQPYAEVGSTTHGFTNTPAYQNAFSQAGPVIARLTTFPDYHETTDADPTSITTIYDPKIDLILENGATPLFLAYTAPNNTTANSNILVADYVDANGENQATNGVTDATVATNVAFLVYHYLGLDGGHYADNPINMQYWEIGNEPDDSVDGNYWGGTTITYKTYCAQFNSVDAALRAISDGQGGTLRDHVQLCGPAMSHPYSSLTNASNGDYTFFNYFLSNCAATGACDIVTRHIYSGTATTDADYLNGGSYGWYDFDASYDASTTSTDRIGEGGLQQNMASLGVPTTVGTGITELNTSTDFHTILQGLWTALMHHYLIYNYHQQFGTAPGGTILTTPIQLNYQSMLSTGFIFDTFGTGLGGFGYFTTDATGSSTPWTDGDYNYWASYIMNKLTGGIVLSQSYTTALAAGTPTPLVCTATEDGQYLYVQVINRSFNSSDVAQAVTDTIDLDNVGFLGTGSVYTLSGTVNNLPLNGGTPGTQAGGTNPSFSYTFPAESITVFRFPRGVPTDGLMAYYEFEQNVEDSSGNDNNGTARTGFSYSTNAKQGSYSGLFNGTGGRVYVPDSPSLEVTGNLTVACWVNTSVFTGNADLIAKSFNSAYRFRVTAGGEINLILGNGDADSPVQKTSTQKVTSGVWTHVAATVTFSGTTATFRFYINGVADPTPQTATLSSIQAGTGALVLGCASDGDDEPFNGNIDEAVIYNRALSAAEIAGLAEQ